MRIISLIFYRCLRQAETENYTPLLLTIEVIFTELLKRGDLVQHVVPLKPTDTSPEAEYKRWLNECYEAAISRALQCIKCGRTSSRLQALVTACKLLQAEGKHPLEPTTGKPQFPFNPSMCRRCANRCWSFACLWPLCEDSRTHRRALLLLVERLMPLLNKPHLATDMLCDSLDAGGPISMLALQGVLELVRRHNIEYPDLYDRLYAMFEPEMFATRYKKRLLHLADIFLSSTHLPESLVAAFAKRLARLALVACPEDAGGLLQLVANLLLRHPALKRMICCEDTPAISE
ncbi:jg15697 [Pararge aegeria aegeria]|uniref:Jg15697 protein n=1 Tax=Pararge aegeria aegeria TaxID=348720 RepID=A0A8S4SKH6_9NEOP|nr:jg15697 [Pararge aegeria aegeria]